MTQPPIPPLARPVPIAMRIILWIVWIALLLAPLSFTFVEALIFSSPSAPPSPPPDPHGIRVLFYVALFGSIANVGFFQAAKFITLRLVSRRGTRTGMLIAYPICKLAAWCACEGSMFFNLVVCLIARSFYPTLPVAAILWLILASDPPLCLPFARRNPQLPA